MISVGEAAVERHLAGEQLEQHDAEREQIGAMVDGAPERLLRRHVGDGTDHHPRHRHLRLRHLRPDAGRDELGQAEIEHLDQPALGAHQVRALDVAMDDAVSVRFVEGVGDLEADFDHLAHRQRPLRRARGQQFAVDVLHDDEVGAAVLADVVGDRDVRGAEHRGGPASFSSRARLSGSDLRPAGRNLSATGRPSRVPRRGTLRPFRPPQGARRSGSAGRLCLPR